MANKVYTATETAVVWGSEVGDDEALTSESVSNGAGRRGAMHDWGAASRADRFSLEAWFQDQATPTALAAHRVYVYEGGSETATSDHETTGGTSDAAISDEDDLANADHILSVLVRTAAANTEFASRTIIEVLSRHWGVAFWNASGATTTADAAESKIRVTPYPPEIQ